jgi:TonB family protein
MALIVGASASAQSDAVRSSPNADTPRQKVRLSPQALQAIFLKGQMLTMQLKGQMLTMQKAAGSAKDATCLLSLWYSSDGTIHAVQLVKASGYPSVDQACLQAAIGQRVESTAADHEMGGRTYFPIHWIFGGKDAYPAAPRIESDPSIPRLPSGGAMNPLPPYPEEALAQRAHGICKMHIAVSESGAVSSIEITQRTGSPALDEACTQAIYKTAITPATNEGRPASGTTDVAIDWRLPKI